MFIVFFSQIVQTACKFAQRVQGTGPFLIALLRFDRLIEGSPDNFRYALSRLLGFCFQTFIGIFLELNLGSYHVGIVL